MLRTTRVLMLGAVVLGLTTDVAHAQTDRTDCTIYEFAGVLPAVACTSADLTPDESRVYVRHNYAPNDDGFRCYDTTTLLMLGECHVAGVPWAGRVSADGSRLWVSRYYGGYVSEVDPNSCAIGCDLNVGSWTDDLLFDDARRYLFVGENDPGTGAIGSVQVVDTTTCTVVQSIPLNGEPGRFAKAPNDPFVYVTTRNSGTERLYQIDAATWQVVNTVDLPGIRDAGFSVSPDGSRVYVPDISSNSILVLAAATLGVVDAWPIPAGDPSLDWGFYVEPLGVFALLATGGDTVKIFSLPRQMVVSEVELGFTMTRAKHRPAWTADGSTAYLPMGGDVGVPILTRVPPVSFMGLISVCGDCTGDYASIAEAIVAAGDGDEIVVCPGTYNESIDLMGKAITLRSAHGPEVTTIVGTGGSVVRCVSGEGPDTVLRGFTITGGNIGSGSYHGGMHNDGSSPTVIDCIFEGNAGGDGGGMANFNGASPYVANCIFRSNTASDGGGMENQVNCNPIVVGCLFYDNHANVGANPDGGAVRNVDSTPTFINCTFFGNTALRAGGGVACFRSTVDFANCVFWGNVDGSGAGESAQIWSDGNSTITVTYSCIEGLSIYAGLGNIGDDPMLVVPGGSLGLPGTWAGNAYRLWVDSPCIDAGDTTAVPPDLFVDLAGNGRRLNWPGTADTGIAAGIVPVTVDMGAYEFRSPVGDTGIDGRVGFEDINPFVGLLTGAL